jgi:hypothetical protein
MYPEQIDGNACASPGLAQRRTKAKPDEFSQRSPRRPDGRRLPRRPWNRPPGSRLGPRRRIDWERTGFTRGSAVRRKRHGPGFTIQIADPGSAPRASESLVASADGDFVSELRFPLEHHTGHLDVRLRNVQARLISLIEAVPTSLKTSRCSSATTMGCDIPAAIGAHARRGQPEIVRLAGLAPNGLALQPRAGFSR